LTLISKALAMRASRAVSLSLVKKMKTRFVATLVVALVISGVVAFKLGQASVESPAVAMENPTTKPTQMWTCGMHPQVIQDHPGNCPICHMKLTPIKVDDENPAAGKKQKVAYWWDPMLGPSSISNHPGKSGMGMDMVPVYEQQVKSGAGVHIDPAVVQNMGVLTAPVMHGPVQVSVRAIGMLEVPEPAVHDVTLKITGYVQKLYADTMGMSVSRGQVLFDLYSPDLQVAGQELISATGVLKNLDAKTDPAVRKQAERMVESTKRKLRLWDIADQDIDAIAAANTVPSTVPIRSPVDGHIEDKAIVQGSAITPGMKIMRIEDHSKLWLDAQVYADQSAMVHIGQDVSATIDGLPGKTYPGKVSFLNPHLDHMLRTEIVRTILDNRKHELLPGMYATARIATVPVEDAILAPREAVIDTGKRQIVFVADPADAGHFEPRNVRVGIVGDDGMVQIVEGLAAGDNVVTSGQFLMDVESRTTEAIQKLRSGNPTTQPN
jgi:RND family efflux transporter MFP subunit